MRISKVFRIIFLLVTSTLGVYAQSSEFKSQPSVDKPPIPMDVLGTWPYLDRPTLSPQGNFVSYNIMNQPVESHTLLVCDTGMAWTKEFIGASDGLFSEDNRLFVFKIADTLCLLDLETNKLERVPGIRNLQSPSKAKGAWICYQLKDNANRLIARNLITNKEKQFDSVSTYLLSNNGGALLLRNNNSCDMRYVNLKSDEIKEVLIDNNIKIKSITFDKSEQQLALIATSGENENSIWYYNTNMREAVMLADNRSPGIDSNLSISSTVLFFYENGHFVGFSLEPKPETRRPKRDNTSVDVWNYKDLVLQSVQINQPTRFNVSFAAVTSTKGKGVIRLDKNGERISNNGSSDFAIIVQDRDKFLWEKDNASYYLISIKDGTRKFIVNGIIENYGISPNGNYVLFYDKKKKAYFSFHIRSGIIHNITQAVYARLENEYSLERPGKFFPQPVGIGGWLENDSALLIYDNYDIWQVDPDAKKVPVNLTNGIGNKEQIRFRIINETNLVHKAVNAKTPLLLTAFNSLNKYNGFYHLFLGRTPRLEKLVNGACRFIFGKNQQASPRFNPGMPPICAAKANVWIVRRESSTEAPNYYLTTDFKNLKPLTNIQPQKNYNWLTTELITYKQLDGTISQGILYKPENFNPQKKYPIIFHYYESLSESIYEYIKPELAYADIDIPWFVSNGYLVFTPDIHYSYACVTGKVVGDAAVNSVVSAAKNLIRRPYIDVTRMGVQGHSFGGGETLYIITHSKIFAAACAAAPTVSDQISAYLSIHNPKGKPLEEFRLLHSESGHDHIGATLWERPDLYIRASPVFNADKVLTPLLIMHNQDDVSTNWEQGIEMFIALRRLGKRVWMLQYDGEGHSLANTSNMIDFSIRLKQFFDHYLKGVAAPKWMTQGIPATMKGIETGYDIDKFGVCGNGCKICTKR